MLAIALFSSVLTGSLEEPTPYLTWGFIQVSRANLVVILIMVLLLALALLLPFPKGKDES